MPPKLIRELTDKSDLWKIVVRVMRLWNLYDKVPPYDVFCVTMVLLDAEGNKIQASALGKSLCDSFSDTLEEKKTYRIENFKVSHNGLSYKAATHKYKIQFSTMTYVEEEAAEIPMKVFTFMPIEEIRAIPESASIDHLIDVIGFVKSMGKLEEFPSQPGKYLLRMVLTDEKDNDIECVLFDQSASDAAQSQLQNDDTDNAIVAVINLARVTWSLHNGRQIASSFEATRVYFNHDIPEVKTLLASLADRATPLVTQFTQSMLSQRSRVSAGESLSNEPRVTLDKIPEQPEGDDFVVACQLLKFETIYNWWYTGCAKCNGKPKAMDQNVPNSPLFCGICKKTPDKTEPKMKLTFSAEDETGIAMVKYWEDGSGGCYFKWQ